MRLAYCICETTAVTNNQQRESILAVLMKYGKFMTPFYSNHNAVLFEVEKANDKSTETTCTAPSMVMQQTTVILQQAGCLHLD
jgi:hypothetical protein